MNRYYDSPKEKVCDRGCGEKLFWKGYTENKGSTGWFLYYNTKVEHTYDLCNKIMKQHKEKVKHGSLFGNDVR